MNDHHVLKLTLTDEGYIEGTIVCPHNGSKDANCATHIPNPDPLDADAYPYVPVDGCWVAEAFGEVGLECFIGKVELPDVLIDWENRGGSLDDSELVIFAIEPQEPS